MTLPVGPTRIDQSFRDRLEINPNATPSYLINQDQLHQVQDAGIQGGTDFSTVAQRALTLIKSLNINNLLNYIPNLNLGDYVSNTTPPGSNNGSPGATGSVGSGSGAGTVGGDLEAQADGLLSEADALANELSGKDWVETDPTTGYEYIDPNFYVEYEKLSALLNALSIIALIIDLIREIKEFIQTAFDPKRKGGAGGEQLSASAAIGGAREIGMLKAQGQQAQMNEAVMTNNQEKLQGYLTEAKKNSEGSWYDYLSEVVTSGGSDAVSRHGDARYADKAYQIMQDYESFQNGVQNKYQEVLAKSSLFADGVTNIGDVMASLTSNNLLVDIGGGKVDIDRNKLVADQMRLSGMENYRRLLFTIQLAKKELNKMIIEVFTGAKHSSNVKRVLTGLCDTLDKVGGMIFSAMTNQLQSTISAQNGRVDAYNQKELAWSMYYSSATLGSIPLIGGLTKNISDYFALLHWNETIDDVTSPVQLQLNQVYQYLADMSGMTVDQIRREFSSNEGDKFGKILGDLERREWDLLGRLDKENIIQAHSDGMVEILEKNVNALREELDRVQNMEREILILAEAIQRITKAVIKIMTGVGEIEDGGEVKNALKSGAENRMTAFDLKFAGIKAKVEAINKEIKEQKQLEKAGYVALGSFALGGVAVALLAGAVITAPFTGGLGIIAAVGFIAACGQLGASIAQITWNGFNPVDSKVYDQTQFFMDNTLDAMDNKYNQQLDRLTENAHVDAEDSSDPLRAANQWGRDTKLFMDVRNKLTKIYIYEQVLNMIIKAQQDVKNGLISSFTGVNLGDDYDVAQEASSARFSNKIKAYELKQNMIDDLISRRNMKVDQETEMNWGMLQAGISVLSIVSFGLSSELESAAARNVMGWVNFGFDLTALAASGTKQLLDATSGYGALDKLDDIRNLIDEIAKSFTLEDGDRATLSNAMAEVDTENMEVGTRSGKVTVDSSKYYQAMRSVQHYFNRVTALLRLAEAINRIKARLVGGTPTVGMSDAFEKAKASVIKQLDLLQDRVKAHVERTNAMAEAWRQFTITVVMIAYKIFMKIAEKQGWLSQLKKTISDKLPAKGITLIKDPGLAARIGRILSGNKGTNWDGKITLGSLTSLLIDCASSQHMIKLITTQVYDAAYGKGKGTIGVSKLQRPMQTNESAAASQIDRNEDEAFNNQLELAQIGLDSTTLEVLKKLQQEMTKFIANEIAIASQSPFDQNWEISMPVIKHFTERKEEDGALSADEQRFFVQNKHLLVDISRKFRLENVNWNNPQEVAQVFAKINAYIDQAKAIDGKYLKPEQKKVLFEAIAMVVGERILKNPNYKQNAIRVLKDIVSKQLANGSAMDVNSAAQALAILGAMTKVEGKAALSGDEVRGIDTLINNVWAKAAGGQISEESARKICDSVKSFRTQAYNAGVNAYLQHKHPEMGELPPEIIAALSRLNLDTVDFSDPKKVKEAFEAVKRLAQEEKIDGKRFSDMILGAAVIAAARIAVDPANQAKARETFINIVRDPSSTKDKALLDYANAVLGKMALSDLSAQLGFLPQEVQQALMRNTNLASVDWKDPNKIRETFGNIQEFVRQGTVNGKPLSPAMQQAVMKAAVMLVVAQITPKGEMDVNAVNAFAKIVKQAQGGKDKALVDFSNAVIGKAVDAEELSAQQAAAKAAAKVKPHTLINNLIYRMNSRVKAMEWSKSKAPSEQLAKFRVDFRRFIELSAKVLGVNLSESLQKLENAKTPADLANVLEGLEGVLKNPKLKLSDSAKLYARAMVDDLRKIGNKMKEREEKAKKPAVDQRPAQAPAALDFQINNYDKYNLRPSGRGQKVDLRTPDRVPEKAVAERPSPIEKRNGSNGTKLADAGVKANGNSSYLDADQAVKKTFALHNGNGNHNGLS